MSNEEQPYSAVTVWRVALSTRFEQRSLSLRKLKGVIQFNAGDERFHFVLGGAKTAICEGVHGAPDAKVEVNLTELRKLMFAEGEPECVFLVAGDYGLYEEAFKILSREEEEGQSWLSVRAKS